MAKGIIETLAVPSATPKLRGHLGKTMDASRQLLIGDMKRVHCHARGDLIPEAMTGSRWHRVRATE